MHALGVHIRVKQLSREGNVLKNGNTCYNFEVHIKVLKILNVGQPVM